MKKRNYTNSTRVKYKRRFSKKTLRTVLAAVLLILIVGALELTNATHFFHKEHVELTGTTGSDETKGEPGSSNSNNNNGSESAQTEAGSIAASSATKDENESGNNSTNLIAPSGNFVSSHHLRLSDAGNVASTCNTTPRAKCTITFTKNGVIKSLVTKATDSGGAAYWSWIPKDIGLSMGSWQIKAVASQGSNQESSTDALSLEVSE